MKTLAGAGSAGGVGGAGVAGGVGRGPITTWNQYRPADGRPGTATSKLRSFRSRPPTDGGGTGAPPALMRTCTVPGAAFLVGQHFSQQPSTWQQAPHAGALAAPVGQQP